MVNQQCLLSKRQKHGSCLHWFDMFEIFILQFVIRNIPIWIFLGVWYVCFLPSDLDFVAIQFKTIKDRYTNVAFYSLFEGCLCEFLIRPDQSIPFQLNLTACSFVISYKMSLVRGGLSNSKNVYIFLHFTNIRSQESWALYTW